MKSDFYPNPKNTNFYLYVSKNDNCTHFAMLSGVNQLALYGVSNPKIKESVMSHYDVDINDNLNFLIFGMACKTVEDVIDIFEDSISVMLNNLRNGVHIRNSRGFLVLHRKPEHTLGTVYVDDSIDKSTKKLLVDMCDRLSEKYKGCVVYPGKDIVALKCEQFCSMPIDMRDAVCQELHPVAKDILRSIDNAIGSDMTSISAFERALSAIKLTIAYQ